MIVPARDSSTALARFSRVPGAHADRDAAETWLASHASGRVDGSRNVNQNTNRNVNRNVNRDVDRDIDVDGDNGYYRGGRYYA